MIITCSQYALGIILKQENSDILKIIIINYVAVHYIYSN